MYGEIPYASVPYAALGGTLLVAACIHVASQLLYTCDVAKNLVYTVSVSGSVCPCDSSGAVC
jgi:hypothetical protein